MKNEWDTWNDMSDAERMRAWWSIRDALRVYGGHIPPCKGRPCECGFREAWKMAGLPVTTAEQPDPYPWTRGCPLICTHPNDCDCAAAYREQHP